MPLTLYPSGTLILYEYRFRFTLRYALFLSIPTNKQSLHIMFALQLWLLASFAVSYHRFAIDILHFFDFARMFFIISFLPFYRVCTFTLIHFDTFHIRVLWQFLCVSRGFKFHFSWIKSVKSQNASYFIFDRPRIDNFFQSQAFHFNSLRRFLSYINQSAFNALCVLDCLLQKLLAFYAFTIYFVSILCAPNPMCCEASKSCIGFTLRSFQDLLNLSFRLSESFQAS